MYGVGSVRQWYNAHTKFSENRQLVQKFKRGTHSKCISWWSKDSFFFLVARKAGQRSRIAYEARRRHRSRFVIKFSIISKCEFTTCMTLSKTRSHNCHKRHVCIDTLILLRVPPMLTATSGKLQIQGVGYIKWQDCSLLFAGNATYQKTMAYNEYRDQFQSKIFLVLWKVLMLCFFLKKKCYIRIRQFHLFIRSTSRKLSVISCYSYRPFIQLNYGTQTFITSINSCHQNYYTLHE